VTISQVGLTHKGGNRQNTAKIQPKYSQNTTDQNEKNMVSLNMVVKNIGAGPALRLTQ